MFVSLARNTRYGSCQWCGNADHQREHDRSSAAAAAAAAEEEEHDIIHTAYLVHGRQEGRINSYFSVPRQLSHSSRDRKSQKCVSYIVVRNKREFQISKISKFRNSRFRSFRFGRHTRKSVDSASYLYQ